MKIVQAQIYPLSIPLIYPIKMSGETINEAKTVVLRLIDDSGFIGWGEASVAPLMTGETLDSLLGNLRYLLLRVRDLDWKNPCEFNELFNRVLYGNSSVKSCLQMALLDLHTKHKEIPLWKYLRELFDKPSLENPPMLPILRMIGGSPEKELADAAILRKEGYRHWKIKVGLLPIESDIDRVEALCSVLQGDVVSVDANGAMNLDNAVRFCTSDKTKLLAFAEQLISAKSSVCEFRELKKQSKIPIGLDESIHGVNEIERFIELKSFDGASLKLIKTGGLIESMECAQLLEKNGLKVNLACKVAETSISAAATAALGFAMGNIPWGFSMSNQYLRFDVCEQPLKANQGFLNIEQLIPLGIGIAPEDEILGASLAKGYSIISC